MNVGRPGASAQIPPFRPEAVVDISVVVTVKNEAKRLGDLLDSLVPQRADHEVLVVDSDSTDATVAIADEYAQRFPLVRVMKHTGTRGDSRNAGVRAARGNYVAFIDGDCIANAFWLEELTKTLRDHPIAAGRTAQMGYWAFANLQRVELPHKGQDVTFPSCNLAYAKRLFEEIGGFDPRFQTAEDIDLNLRAVNGGGTIGYNPKAVVYHRARESVSGFFRQAYWNGYGRKQLTLKHGKMWRQYSFRQLLRKQTSFWALARLGFAMAGYLACKMKERPEDYRPPTLVSGVPVR